MIKERAMQLADALESGKYQQTRSHLRDARGFCCLGVACDVSGLGKWVPWTNGHYSTYMGASRRLPSQVARYFNFASETGEARLDAGRSVELTTMNDEGKTFAEIAAFIRENWEKL